MEPSEKVSEQDRYRCRLCGKPKVVPQLARDCERKHLEGS